MKDMITLQTTIQRNERQLLASELGDELVILDTEKGNYVNLNKIGRAIWQKLEQPLRVDELVRSLALQYNISEEDCAKDTLPYLEQLQKQDLLFTS